MMMYIHRTIGSISQQSLNSDSSSMSGAAKRKKRKAKKKKQSSDRKEVSEDLDEDSDDNVLLATVPTNQIEANMSSVDIDAFISNQIVDPLSVTIEDVIKRSEYSRDRVTACVTYMWDQQLQYDNADAVLMQLRLEDNKLAYAKAFEQEETQREEEEIERDVTVEVNVEVGEGDVSATPVKIIIAEDEGGTGGFLDNDAVTSDIQSQPLQEAVTLSSSSMPMTPSQVSPSLESMVSTPSVLEALEAVTSWLSIAGTGVQQPHSVNSNVKPTDGPKTRRQLFMESNAFDTLLQKLLAANTKEVQSGALVNALSSFLQNVLNLPDEDSAPAISALLSQIEMLRDLLRQLNSSALSTKSTDLSFFGDGQGMLGSTNNVPGVVALAHRLASAFRETGAFVDSKSASVAVVHAGRAELAASTEALVTRTLPDLDAEATGLEAAIARLSEESAKDDESDTAQSHLQSSLTLRDMAEDRLQLRLKALEEVASVTKALQKQTARAGSVKTMPQSPKLLVISSPELDQQLEWQILSDCGETHASLEAKRAHSGAITAYLDRLTRERDERSLPLLQELRAGDSKLMELQLQENALYQQLQKVQFEIGSCSARSAVLRTALKDCQHEFEQNMIATERSNRTIVRAVKLRDTLNAITSKMKTLESSITDAYGVGDGEYTRRLHRKREEVNRFAQAISFEPDVECPARVIMSSQALDAFGNVQSKCMALLAKRVSLADGKLKHLKDELRVYKELSMEGMVTSTSQTMESLSSNIEEDMAALKHLQTEFVGFLVRFATCLSIGLPGAGGATLPDGAIREAIAALRSAGINPAQELLAFSASSHTPPRTAVNAGSVGASPNGSSSPRSSMLKSIVTAASGEVRTKYRTADSNADSTFSSTPSTPSTNAPSPNSISSATGDKDGALASSNSPSRVRPVLPIVAKTSGWVAPKSLDTEVTRGSVGRKEPPASSNAKYVTTTKRLQLNGTSGKVNSSGNEKKVPVAPIDLKSIGNANQVAKKSFATPVASSSSFPQKLASRGGADANNTVKRAKSFLDIQSEQEAMEMKLRAKYYNSSTADLGGANAQAADHVLSSMSTDGPPLPPVSVSEPSPEASPNPTRFKIVSGDQFVSKSDSCTAKPSPRRAETNSAGEGTIIS